MQLSLLLLFILSGAISKIPLYLPYSEDEENNFMLNPFGLFSQQSFSAQYGRVLSGGKFEVYFPLQMFTTTKHSIFDEDPETGLPREGQLTGFGGGMGFRVYPLARFQGPFVGVGSMMEVLDGEYNTKGSNSVGSKQTFSGYGLSPYGELGFRWLWLKGITVTPRIMPAMLWYTIKADSTSRKEVGWEYPVLFDVSIGITY
jgi:hypothetical protein